jgi:uncharacterized protein YecE (DUF72 family)
MRVMVEQRLHIGTCSWKFPAWKGLVYSGGRGANLLEEYARRFDCVEIDQWFWSLFGPDKVALPQDRAVAGYAASVSEGFRFGVKLPDALTMTHFRPDREPGPPVPNPHFLSPDLLRAFMARLEPLRGKLGPLMLQFGYLNRQMMASQDEFLGRLDGFARQLPEGFTWCVETRNPAWLNEEHFRFLSERGLGHVWEQGYYMPAVAEVYPKFAERLAETCVVRLHGPDWEGMERRVGKDWSRIAAPRDADLAALVAPLKDMLARRKETWVFVNNHFEGCAPKTVERLMGLLGLDGGHCGGESAEQEPELPFFTCHDM